VANDRATRRRATTAEVRKALAESKEWQKRRRVPEALSAARRATGVVAGGEAAPALRREVEARVADLELLVRLQDVRLEMTAIKSGHFDEAMGDRRYGEVFREGNLDINALSVDVAGERIRGTTVAVELAAMLDDWAVAHLVAWPRDYTRWKHLTHVAIAADPDDWRTRLREALVRNDRDTLVELASIDDAAQLLPPSLHALVIALTNAGAFEEADTLLREAQRQHPDDFWINQSLAEILQRSKPHGDAERIAFLRVAVALRPQSPGARLSLGNALRDQGDLNGAIAECREAIRLKNDYAEAHYHLGLALLRRGQFPEAADELRCAQKLSLNDAFRPAGSGRWLRECERLVKLEAKLPEVLKGEVHPANVAERLELAELCRRPYKALYATAVRFYSDTFSRQPHLTDDLDAGHRYNAACAAALAGCGQGKDANQSDDKERARLRQQSLEWLQADLAIHRRDLEMAPDKAAPAVRERMQQWQRDKDFTGVRGPDALAKLPEAERQDWQKLWAEVAEILSQAQARTVPPDKPAGK
jgi:tetratricopeptide (TPR) repeat protein